MPAFRARPAVSAAALLALLGTAQAAQAALTAQDVWDDWKANLQMSAEDGVSVGSEEAGDGSVTVTDFAYNSTGTDGTVVSFTIPEITFTEAGDGTVDVTLSEESPLTIATPANADTASPASDVALTMRQTGLDVSVSGDPGALAYDVSAPRFAIELDSVTNDGAAMPAEGMIAFNDVAGTSTASTADLRSMAQDVTVASVDILVDVTNPDDGSHVSFSGQLQDLAFNGTAELPLDAAANPDLMLMNGLSLAGGYSSGPGQYIFEVTDASGPTSGTIATQGGEANFAIDGTGLGYTSLASGLAIQATSAQLPFPINVSLAEYGLKVLMPAQKSEEPQDWSLGVNLTDLSVNDEIWSMFDPQGMLSHDPATMIVDLSGTARLFFDLFDPSQQEAMNAAPVPGEIDSVSIDDLNLALGGAQVTGTGAFTLDNADTTTFPGMPKPTGSVDLALKGVNGLIDDLVAMGLLPQEQVMGARMFLGVLAVPVAGEEDSLTSHIEVTADGQLLANGQRLQ